jgi:hypothetical protein
MQSKSNLIKILTFGISVAVTQDIHGQEQFNPLSTPQAQFDAAFQIAKETVTAPQVLLAAWEQLGNNKLVLRGQLEAYKERILTALVKNENDKIIQEFIYYLGNKTPDILSESDLGLPGITAEDRTFIVTKNPNLKIYHTLAATSDEECAKLIELYGPNSEVAERFIEEDYATWEKTATALAQHPNSNQHIIRALAMYGPDSTRYIIADLYKDDPSILVYCYQYTGNGNLKQQLQPIVDKLTIPNYVPKKLEVDVTPPLYPYAVNYDEKTDTFTALINNKWQKIEPTPELLEIKKTRSKDMQSILTTQVANNLGKEITKLTLKQWTKRKNLSTGVGLDSNQIGRLSSNNILRNLMIEQGNSETQTAVAKSPYISADEILSLSSAARTNAPLLALFERQKTEPDKNIKANITSGIVDNLRFSETENPLPLLSIVFKNSRPSRNDIQQLIDRGYPENTVITLLYDLNNLELWRTAISSSNETIVIAALQACPDINTFSIFIDQHNAEMVQTQNVSLKKAAITSPIYRQAYTQLKLYNMGTIVNTNKANPQDKKVDKKSTQDIGKNFGFKEKSAGMKILEQFAQKETNKANSSPMGKQAMNYNSDNLVDYWPTPFGMKRPPKSQLTNGDLAYSGTAMEKMIAESENANKAAAELLQKQKLNAQSKTLTRSNSNQTPTGFEDLSITELEARMEKVKDQMAKEYMEINSRTDLENMGPEHPLWNTVPSRAKTTEYTNLDGKINFKKYHQEHWQETYNDPQSEFSRLTFEIRARKYKIEL